MLLLAVLFALCWLPYNVLRLLVDLGAVGEYDLARTLLRSEILCDSPRPLG